MAKITLNHTSLIWEEGRNLATIVVFVHLATQLSTLN